MNPPPWLSDPWWRWFLTIALAAVVAGLLVPAIRGTFARVWSKWFQFHVVVFITKWTVGRHDCGHRLGSYTTDANGRRVCLECDQARYRS